MQLPDKPVSWLRLFLKMGGWVPIGLGVLTLILSAVAWQMEARADRFEREGVYARATITGKEVRESTDSDGDTRYTYLFDLSYRVDGAETTQTKSTGRRDYRARAVGDVIDIRYLESQPARIDYPIGASRSGATALRWVVLLPGVVALGLLWLMGGWATTAAMTRWNGTRVVARTTGTKRTNTKVNDRYRYRLTWLEPDGRTGESLMHSEADLRAWTDPPRDIVVYRDGENAYWEGDIGPRKGLPPGP
ncbi:MAG: DUF3592 domain-containing protein [Shimia sp.]